MPKSRSLLDNTTEFASRSSFVAKYGHTALRFYLLELARAILPDERIKVCWRYPLPARDAIEIIYSEELGRARSVGTMKCGSSWVCPVCMGYIAERRRQELGTAIERCVDSHIMVMVTYTAQHHAGTRLAPQIASMVTAYGKTRSGRFWQSVKKHYQIAGSVRALEVTYGKNGWHPHFHELLFMDRAMLTPDSAGSFDELEQSLKGDIGGQWYEKLMSMGLDTDIDKAFDVRAGNRHAADYVAKYGYLPKNGDLSAPAYEVTHSTTKAPQSGNLSILDILFNSAQDDQCKELYREYHGATKGRSQLQWSRGLKALLDIEVIRDEIAARGVETESDRLLAEIEIYLWRYITRHGHLGQVMTYANEGDERRLGALLVVIKQRWFDWESTRPVINWSLGH